MSPHRTSIGLIGAVALGALTVSGCASLPDWLSGRPPVEDGPGVVEPIRAAAVGQDTVLFWISSNGCTEKSDLVPVVRETYDGARVTLRRVRDDRCTNPEKNGVELRWSFEEMGLAPGTRLQVANPYRPAQG
ncbi:MULTISPECIES: hypothetical protein [unclassified Brevundimonas]|jgi:hypothetical protein|uniref:hypothetical protein n=1 Tax=unclassified Brevundimonas TaxID=2622653 RepID=UPI00257A2EC9|nr:MULTISPECIES: hypothetical protein [unclassified Brevundimonas]|tara:strand:+ start:7358 stop:7753 length:396 start_codon:yes stop_codon:yes gene_type:complete